MDSGFMLECAGVLVDAGSRSICALGRRLPVTAVAYSEGSPERPGTDRIATPEKEEIARLIWKTPARLAAAILRPIQAMPESLHFNVLCENGWWIETCLWPEDDAMSFGLPPGGLNANEEGTVVDLLLLLAEVGTRPTYVPSDEYDDPWGGLAPGEWDVR